MSDVVAIPAEVVEKHGVKMLVVRAFMNGRGPFRLLVDTGANAMCFSLDLAPELGLRNPRSTSVAAVQGRAIAATAYELDSIELVEEQGRRYEAKSLELVPIPMTGYEEEIYHGILGMNLLNRFHEVCFRMEPPMLHLHQEP